MIAILFYLIQAVPPAPAATPAVEEDIVVIGERLKRWAGRANDTIGIKTCRTTQSTGDAEIDRIGCRALTECLTTIRPQMDAAYKAAGRDKEKRRALMVPVNKAFGTCTADRRKAMIADLIARRARGAQ